MSSWTCSLHREVQHVWLSGLVVLVLQTSGSNFVYSPVAFAMTLLDCGSLRASGLVAFDPHSPVAFAIISLATLAGTSA